MQNKAFKRYTPSSASVTASVLEYRPLDYSTFEIRILTILEPTRHEAANSIIRCSLDHITLVEPPQYRALSYCCEFYLNVYLLAPITLRHIRHRLKFDSALVSSIMVLPGCNNIIILIQ
jgi:hypothetical protein